MLFRSTSNMNKQAAPVYKFESDISPYVLILHKSTKHRPELGFWQVTYFNSKFFFEGDRQPDPVGDSEFASYEDAVEYLEDQGYHLVEKVEDQQKILAIFGVREAANITDLFYEKTKADKGSPCASKEVECRDRGVNVQLVDRDAEGDPTERGEITQLENEKSGDDISNRTQEH